MSTLCFPIYSAIIPNSRLSKLYIILLHGQINLSSKGKNNFVSSVKRSFKFSFV